MKWMKRYHTRVRLPQTTCGACLRSQPSPSLSSIKVTTLGCSQCTNFGKTITSYHVDRQQFTPAMSWQSFQESARSVTALYQGEPTDSGLQSVVTFVSFILQIVSNCIEQPWNMAFNWGTGNGIGNSWPGLSDGVDT